MHSHDFGLDGNIQLLEPVATHSPNFHEIPLAEHFHSHDGLRGAAAVWIMLFHCIAYCKTAVNLQGSSIMPLFFLLSGYSLAITYSPCNGMRNAHGSGRREETVNNEGQLESSETREELADEMNPSPKPVEFLSFYRNRLVRVYPVYIFCTLLALPLWFNGYGSTGDMGAIIVSIITSVLPLNTFFITLLGAPLDGPGWTICTLLFLWLAFPWSLTRAQKMTDFQLVNWIRILYFVQLALVFILYYVLVPFFGFWPAFAAATMHPFSRYPLFLMGVFAGELNARHWGRGPLPWSPTRFGYPVMSSGVCCNGQCKCQCSCGCERPCSCCACDSNTKTNMNIIQQETMADDVKFWSSRADYMSGGLLIVTLLVAAGDTALKILSGDMGADLGGHVWLQAIVPYAQLEVIIALTRDEGQSLAAKALRTPVAVWLGKHSMSIYLLHWVVIFYLCWAVHGGPLTWPTEDCDKLTNPSQEYTSCVDTWIVFFDARTIPYWGIPVVVVISLCLSACITMMIEEPLRKMLKKR